MREAVIDVDGWCLEDGEFYHHRSPDTFWIPPLRERQSLRTGDYAKLIFRLSLDGAGEIAIERMWVIVRERVADGYLGLLDNNPYAIEQNDHLWSGVELPFWPRHVIDIRQGDPESIIIAAAPPRRRWYDL